MLLLALDTSTTAITAALHDGARVLAESTTLDARAHAEQLAPGVERVLTEAGVRAPDLTDVVCGLGPGPFTGLRAGVVTARVLALATGARLHGICSLDALAHQAWTIAAVGGPELLVATDARRKEVYWARYAVSSAGTERRSEPAVTRPADLPADVRALVTVGRGPLLYPDLLPVTPPAGPLDVSAASLADLTVRRLAAGEALDETAVVYLRRPDAATSFFVKSVLG
ncbi:tRNA (adenosine(37)-N6)-threonylcarbamoyltransferase complex dimerization subunit type 1 TsaB [Lapillicoccus sp.]|uniref:tRNA (adenosine(37)-N6)-threonylcarbamoyltransferase complex dimerization subunit type 1 TsaB n=1 Tax=Lapillicoccus sp. TaxID=1909287 RepID=UPI003265A69D